MSAVTSNPTPSTANQPMAQVISVLLISGVSISALVLAVGLALLAATGRTGYSGIVAPALVLTRQPTIAFPRTFGGAWQGATALRPFAVIELGVLLLIATPVVRVAASVFLFFLKKDYLYTGITLVVLGLLLISLFVLG
jgi:uncharacterized membrane protein